MTSASDAGLRKINLVRIAHVYYTHKGIGKAHQFLQDFGLQELKRVGNKTYFGGTGPEPFVYCASEGSADEFGGAAFVVESKDDLEYAAKTLHNATEVHEMLDEPGGGLRVTFFDPVDGFPFHLVYGQRLTEGAETGSARQKLNYVRRTTKCEENETRLLLITDPHSHSRPRSCDQQTSSRGSRKV